MKSYSSISFLLLISLACSKAFVQPRGTSQLNFPKFTDVANLREQVILHSKKKDSTATKGGKIQVKLTKHVAGTGSAGDIIMVAPAFFLNKLQKTGSAIRISDDEVSKELAEKKQQEKEAQELAMDLKAKLSGIQITMAKTAGADGKLFGGIGYKAIMEELKKEFPQGCLDAKYIKIIEIKNAQGETEKHDIKNVGEYTATISLSKDISADFKLSIVAE